MYHPYFRGKQFELLAVRETAELLAQSGFVPVIEPVRESLRGLHRALKAVEEAGGGAVVIVNPYHGEHRNGGEDISGLLEQEFSDGGSVRAGILLTEETGVAQALELYEQNSDRMPTLIHAGFTEAKPLADALGDRLTRTASVFFEQHGKLYRRHFANSHRVLLRDGFERQRNADYPFLEAFSDLHATYEDEGMDGFGDFLVVGDEYTEGGGPAYAVAIHLTFIDPDKDDEMFIYHFVSETRDTPTDPAGKFSEALDELIRKLNSGTSKIRETSSVKEFRHLHKRGHFPGLGYVKKLSMKHHIETLAHYFE